MIACWAFFAWALTPPVQGSILTAAGPSAGMTAVSLNISGLYLGTAVAAATGGAVVGTLGVTYVPLAAAALMALAFLLSPPAPHAPGAVGKPVASGATNA